MARRTNCSRTKGRGEKAEKAGLSRRTVLRAAAAAAAGVAGPLQPQARAGEQDPQPGKPSLMAYDDVRPEEYAWGWIRWLMSSRNDPQAEMTLGLVHIEANQSNPLHVHPNCAEYLHVLAGSCEHRIGSRWVTLGVGATLRIPKGTVHAARTGDRPCRVIVVYDTGTRQMTPVADEKPAAGGRG
jgi:quercetin dioxygenase-like cupin family protein